MICDDLKTSLEKGEGTTLCEGAIRFDMSIHPRFRYPEDFDREKFEAWRQLSHSTSQRRISNRFSPQGFYE